MNLSPDFGSASDSQPLSREFEAHQRLPLCCWARKLPSLLSNVWF